MGHLRILVCSALALTCLFQATNAGETVLSTVLTPSQEEDVLTRQSRSYERYGVGRPYERLEYDRARCGRCDERYDDRDDYDRPRDRYDDDRRHRPTNRFDKNKNYDDDDDKKFNSDRRSKNGTDDGEDPDKKRPYDDEKRPSGGRRDRDRDRDRNRYDDRERYRPDYYDRFLGDRNRERERPYYDDPYRRPSYERYPTQDRYDDGYGGYAGYRRPVGGYDERYDRGNGYDDIYGGYGPSSGRGPHDRPWDETYRGQAGWDAGGRGYYFASGRPDAGAAAAWGRPEYNRPETSSGWQSAGYRDPYASAGRDPYASAGRDPYASAGRDPYASAGRDPYASASRDPYATAGRDPYATAGRDPYASASRDPYASAGVRDPYGSAGYRDPYAGGGYAPDTGYRQDLAASYGRPSGWHSVGERRPYRDQSGVNSLETKDDYNQPSRGQSSGYGQNNRGQSYGQTNYGQSNGQANGYGQANTKYGQPTASSSYAQSTTTPGTSYLYQREDEQVTSKPADETTKPPS